jgi:hypothetical protein
VISETLQQIKTVEQMALGCWLNRHPEHGVSILAALDTCPLHVRELYIF